MTSGARILAASRNRGFLHLVQTLMDDIGLPVQATSEWTGVPELAAKLRPDVVILDLVPGYETACWLMLEALRAHAATRSVQILLCPVAAWLVDGHQDQLGRLDVQMWGDNFDPDELLRSIGAAIDKSVSLARPAAVRPT